MPACKRCGPVERCNEQAGRSTGQITANGFDLVGGDVHENRAAESDPEREREARLRGDIRRAVEQRQGDDRSG